MELGYRDVEELFAARHGISEDRRVAFRGRLDHLRKMGCPAGVNTGKGRPAIFGWRQLLELAVALDLVDMGLTPENTALLINAHATALQLAVRRLVDDEDRSAIVCAAESEKWPIDRSILVTAHVGALRGLRADGSAESPSLGFVQGDEVAQWFESADVYESPVTILDLGTKVANLLKLVSIWSCRQLDAIVDDFLGWAEKNTDKLIQGVLNDLDS